MSRAMVVGAVLGLTVLVSVIILAVRTDPQSSVPTTATTTTTTVVASVGAPEIFCYETWTDVPPPFGTGNPYHVFYWKVPRDATITDTTNGYVLHPYGDLVRLLDKGTITWDSRTVDVQAPTTLPPACGWLTAPF